MMGKGGDDESHCSCMSHPRIERVIEIDARIDTSESSVMPLLVLLPCRACLPNPVEIKE
jgi:hypothetical protein